MARAPKQLVIQDQQFGSRLDSQLSQLVGGGMVTRMILLPTRLFLLETFEAVDLVNQDVGISGLLEQEIRRCGITGNHNDLVRCCEPITPGVGPATVRYAKGLNRDVAIFENYSSLSDLGCGDAPSLIICRLIAVEAIANILFVGGNNVFGHRTCALRAKQF